MFTLRKNDSTNKDVYRTPGHPWTTLLIALVSGIFVMSAFVVDTQHSLIGLGVAVAGTPFYFLAKRYQRERE